MPRLFVAVWPPDGVLDQLAALQRPSVTGLRWTTRDQWHVTLRFLGAVDDVAGVESALAGVEVAPVVARLGPVVGRFDHRILHVPVTNLERLAAAVVAATADLGEPPEDRPFRAHITLARATRRPGVDLRPLAGAPLEAEWPVDSVCLVQSHLSPKGARYETLASVPPKR